jgi:hypothetical protein
VALDSGSLELGAEQTEGFSYAQVREAFILAGQLALQRRAEEISREDLTGGIGLVRGEGTRRR